MQNAYPYYPQQEEFYLRDATGNILTTFMRTNSEVAANSWQTSILVGVRNSRRGTSRRISIPMRYEIGNEGNVRNIFTDELLAEQFTPTTTCTNNASCTFNYTNEHIAHPVSMYNYYAFGMPRPNQIIAGTHVITNWYEENGNGYRFGFNGQEKDNEFEGIGNNLAFEARIYYSRLEKWLSVDPHAGNYPSL